MSGRVSSRSLSSALGHDPRLLAGLPQPAQQAIEQISAAWCWAAAGVSAPVGYAAWLLTHGAWLSLAASVASLLMIVQIVRLTVAGAGLPVSASAAAARDYRPAWTPLLWFALLGAMFAQPAQLPLWQRAHRALVEAERGQLLMIHRRALAGARVEPTAASHDNYERQLNDCEFLVLRLCALWQQPERAARDTGIYLALLLGPLLLTQLRGRRALCRYQWLRACEAQRMVQADERRSQQHVDAALAHYASYLRSPARGCASEFAAPLSMRWPVRNEARS